MWRTWRRITRGYRPARERPPQIGCGPGRSTIYWRVLLPNTKPAIATCSIVLFLGMWNQCLWPRLVVQDELHRPVTVRIAQSFGNNLSLCQVLAYANLITLPVLTVFMVFPTRLRPLLGLFCLEGLAPASSTPLTMAPAALSPRIS